MRRMFIGLLASVAAMASADEPITITLLHTNDMHAHVESTKIKGAAYGGYARQATIIRDARRREPNVLLLSAGDTFQGTLYFNTYEGLADLAFMNAVGYNAMAVGNHEFDRGPGPLAKFAGLATFPVLSANLDVSKEPLLKDKVLPAAIIMIGGQRVGVVGATTPDVVNISSPGPNVKPIDLKKSVQATVDRLTAAGVNKVILLTHIGYAEDQALVKTLHDVDVVVGGHSHTPLGTPDLPGWPKAAGPYPTMVKDSAGVEVPIVQCWEWSKVFGHLTIDFDGEGHVLKVSDARPIVVDDSVPEDPAVASMIAAFRRPIEALQTQPVGEASIAIPKEANSVGESLMADVIADAMLAATSKAGAVAAFINSGGVRGGLEAGKVTYGNAISVQPFGNTLVTLDVTGAELKAALEQGVGTGGQLTPSHGSSYAIDRSRPKGDQVTGLTVNGLAVDPTKTYRIGLLNFTANGGDSHFVLRDAKGTRTDTGIIDLDALLDYLKSHSPLAPKADGRIIVK